MKWSAWIILSPAPKIISPASKVKSFNLSSTTFPSLSLWKASWIIFCISRPLQAQLTIWSFPFRRLKSVRWELIMPWAWRKQKKPFFFLASTSEVYGDPLIHPQPEDYWGNVNPIGPRGVYDEAKRFAEAITMAYHRAHGINTKIIRIFNTYGPRMRINDGRAIPNFLKQALTGEDLTIYGDGSQTRSFCYVSDLVEGIYRLLTSDQNYPINIGNPNEMTIREMADKILQATISKSKITHVPLPEDDPKVRQPDITRAKKYLNWGPVVGLDEGLQSTLKYFREQLQT